MLSRPLLFVVPAIALASDAPAQNLEAERWSLRALAAPAVPQADGHPIDVFVRDRLRREGLVPTAPADRPTLIRRLAFDLLGLPPTPDEVDAFVADRREDAFERLVDRMLATPQYGERFARYWLDIVHYGDTHGFDKDKPRPHAWRYRDWVIGAVNDDLPWARFVELQLAGDVTDGDDGVPAIGFIAAGPWDYVGHTELREGTTDKAITRSLDRDDMLKTALASFCSVTVHCARCHDHKYDPIPSRDYYRLQAVFAGVERADRAYLPRAARGSLTELARRDDALARSESGLVARISARAADALGDLDAQRAALTPPELPPLHDDGRAILGWHSQIEPDADVAKWVQVELAAPIALDGVLLVPCHEPYGGHPGPGFGFPVRYRVEIAGDSSFTDPTVLVDHTRSDFAAPLDEPVWIPAGGRRTSHVRVTATRLWERTNDFVFALGELAAFDAAGTNHAHGARVTAGDSIEMGERWSRTNLTDGRTSRGATSDALLLLRSRALVRTNLAELDERRLSILASVTLADEARERTALAAARDSIAAERALLTPPFVYAAATDFAPIGTFTPARAVRPIHVLHRGDVTDERELVAPGALSCLPGLEHHFDALPPDDEGARRRALARWITDPANPLTWRSVVNRVWQFHFGRGLVDTPNDFGRLGAAPSHPELLDWLAAEFRDSGGSLKDLHRLILTSATWRQASIDSPRAATVDSGNALLWRQNRRRLDAESFRDLVLAASGRIDLTLGGEPEQQFRFEDDHSPRYVYAGFDVDDGRRRSIYRMLVRSVPDPFFEALDCADPSQLTPRRSETLTAPHALAIWNDRFMLRHAEHLAERVANATANQRDALAFAMRLVIARQATPTELDALAAHAVAHGLASACRVIFNLDEAMFVD